METGLKKRSRLLDLLIMLPAFIFVLSIMLVRLHQFNMPLTDIYWTDATDTTLLSDLFGYWKALAILGAAFLSIIFLIGGYLKNKIQFKKSFLYIPALIYITCIFVSLFFSDYKYFAIRGMQEHFEGTFVLFAYILMVFFLFNVVDSERRLKYVIYCALCATLLLGVLGITQATGHDFLSTAVGQKLMTPNYMLDSGITSWEMIDILAATGQSAYGYLFSSGEVYQTVYNINYVPLYLSLLIPVSAFLFIFFGTRESKREKVLSIVFLLLFGIFVYNFFAANSASGYFGLSAIFITTLIVFRKSLKRWLKPMLCLIIVLGLIMGLLVDRWLPEIKSLMSSIGDKVIVPVYAENESVLQYEFEHDAGMTWVPVDFIQTDTDSMLFGINGEIIKITRNDEQSSFVITDGDNNQLYMRENTKEPGTFEILDERFHDYALLSLVKSDDGPIVQITTRGYTWPFPYTDKGFAYENRMGKRISLNIVPHSSLIKNYSFGSNRGIIWDTTIPLLSKYVLIGSGADTFTFAYPQNDYATRYSHFGYDGLQLVTDKAHNFYMQNWVNTGLISLLAWLALVGYYLVGAIKRFRKCEFDTFSDFANAGIFCGIIGFLFVAFFNDGSVNTMPMFYTMLGTGLALNARDSWDMTEASDGAKISQMPEI